MLRQHPVLLQYTLPQHPLSSKDNVSTSSSDILTAASHATAAAVLTPGSASTHMELNVAATFGQKMSPVWAYFTKLHLRRCPRDEPGKERNGACVAETARSAVCTPTTVTRCQGFDPTFEQGIVSSNYKIKNVRCKIEDFIELIFASCVGYFDRANDGFM